MVNEEQVPAAIVDRLRANLRAAGVAVAEGDIEGMIEKGFLARIVLFEQLVAGMPADRVPEYLGLWMPAPQEAAAVARQTDATTGSIPPHHGEQAPTGKHGGTISQLAARLRSREVSPVELAEEALGAIAARDAALNAFQHVPAHRAMDGARRAERELAAGDYRGPLHGVPIAVKDLYAMRDTPTTGGSKILAEWITDFDSWVVERLEAAGAVIVGKTKMSEFAYSPGSNNAHYGSTHNPWHLDHDAGGSSSGSAAAVAEGIVYAALGSDTGGSIRIPASLCGIVGLKPTFGRISLYGAITLSWSMDHAGPLTRSVADAALLLEALAGYDPRDPRSRPGGEFRLPEGALERGVRGLRIGVLRDDGSGRELGKPEAVAAWREGLAALERDGAELVEVDLPEIEATRIINSAILALEAASFHAPTLVARLDEYGEFMRHRILSSFAHGPTAIIRAQQARAQARAVCEAIFHDVDLLSTPTMPYGAPLLGVPAATTFTAPFNTLGWPAISVPTGLTQDGLPLGLQLAGRPWDEATVLRAARVVEAAVRIRDA